MEMTGAEIICESLLREGVDTIFGLPGGAVLPFYGALSGYPKLRHILVRHEQAAAMAADGYARATGKVGVCSATSGPGATNLVTGLASAQMDSVPIVCITGQVPRPCHRPRRLSRKPTSPASPLPITKHNYLVMDVADVAPAIKRGLPHRPHRPTRARCWWTYPKDVLSWTSRDRVRLAGPGRPGPGYSTLPGDPDPHHAGRRRRRDDQLRRTPGDHRRPRCPHISGAYDELGPSLAEKAQIPVITTLLGIGSFPTDHYPEHGHARHARRGPTPAWPSTKPTCSSALGMRFDDRSPATDQGLRAQRQERSTIDVDPSEVRQERHCGHRARCLRTFKAGAPCN